MEDCSHETTNKRGWWGEGLKKVGSLGEEKPSVEEEKEKWNESLMGFGEIKEGLFEYYNIKKKKFDLSLKFKFQIWFN